MAQAFVPATARYSRRRPRRWRLVSPTSCAVARYFAARHPLLMGPWRELSHPMSRCPARQRETTRRPRAGPGIENGRSCPGRRRRHGAELIRDVGGVGSPRQRLTNGGDEDADAGDEGREEGIRCHCVQGCGLWGALPMPRSWLGLVLVKCKGGCRESAR